MSRTKIILPMLLLIICSSALAGLDLNAAVASGINIMVKKAPGYDAGMQPGGSAEIQVLLGFGDVFFAGISSEAEAFGFSPYNEDGYRYNRFVLLTGGVIAGINIYNPDYPGLAGPQRYGIYLNPELGFGSYSDIDHLFFCWKIAVIPFFRTGKLKFMLPIEYVQFPSAEFGISFGLTAAYSFL